MKIFRIILSSLLIACIIFTFTIGVSNIDKKHQTLENPEYKGIITFWQVDSFEGGSWSRKQFIMEVARKFEKINDGVLVMATTMTEESVKENIKKGIYPDLISYGNGIDCSNLVNLEVGKSAVAGKIENGNYALPWCKGGYVIISNSSLNQEENTFENINEILVSQSQYTQPLLALLAEDIKVNNITVLPPMEAYTKFVAGKVKYFLGTQRDVVRLNNRGFEYEVKPLEKFCDLYQYVSMTEKGKEKKYTEKFLEYLFSEEAQISLNRISMFSEYYEVNYNEKGLKEMSKVKNLSTISAFLLAEQLKEMQELSLKSFIGESDAYNKLKKFILSP